MTAHKRILIGKITTAHGVRGLVKVMPFGDDPDLLNGALFKTETGGEAVSLTLKNAMGTFWLAEVEGVADRTAAEKLRNTELWIEREKLPQIDEENSYYIADLIGLQVVDVQGNPVGTVIAVENFGAGDLLDIQPAASESFYLPFMQETLQSVDLAARRMIVAMPDDGGE